MFKDKNVIKPDLYQKCRMKGQEQESSVNKGNCDWIKRKNVTPRAVKHWKTWLTGAMKCPTLELFKAQLDEFMNNRPCFDQRLNSTSPFKPNLSCDSNCIVSLENAF